MISERSKKSCEELLSEIESLNHELAKLRVSEAEARELLVRLHSDISIALESLEWMRDQCGYASPVWIRMNDAISKIRAEKTVS
jgi:hypothetical protein